MRLPGRVTYWRAVGLALNLCAIPMLIAGNSSFPVVDGWDLTPFEVGGLVFFAGLLPTAVVLGFMRAWRVMAILAALYHCWISFLAAALLGVAVGMAWFSVAVLVAVLASAPALLQQRFAGRPSS